MYHHSKKVIFKQITQLNISSYWIKCSWSINIWVKKEKGYLEVIKFNDHHVSYECHPSVSKFILILWKLLKEILKEIWFLTIVTKVNIIVQYQIIQKKFKTRIY